MSIGLRPGYFGGNYLGNEYNPFETEGDPNASNFKVRNLSTIKDLSIDRLQDRRTLLKDFDHLRRGFDVSGAASALDRFQTQAYDMVTSPAAAKAFDLSTEDPKCATCTVALRGDKARCSRVVWSKPAPPGSACTSAVGIITGILRRG